MSFQHKQLAAGRWNQLSFIEQMANIGSEVERSLNWQAKNNVSYRQKAFERALELIDLTLDDIKNVSCASRLKELARVREAIVDFFAGTNQYGSTDALWRKYFYHFTYAARRNY